MTRLEHDTLAGLDEPVSGISSTPSATAAPARRASRNIGRDDFGDIPFGGDIHAERRFGALVLPAEITVGW